jgi:hypothetical protein
MLFLRHRNATPSKRTVRAEVDIRGAHAPASAAAAHVDTIVADADAFFPTRQVIGAT